MDRTTMKLTEVQNILGTNGRSTSLVCVFTENAAPVLEFGNSYAACRHIRTDLKDHIEDLKKLRDGQAFTFGREGYNDIDLGEVSDISRLHCYIVREGKTFKLYDCSLFGTAVVLE